MPYTGDTIVAVSTPFGRGGIGGIRISGPDSLDVLLALFHNVSRETLLPRKIFHGWITDNNKPVDEVLFFYLKSPDTYTGEDMAEIFCHGSPAILERVVSLCIGQGARQALAGEFTKRAFLNGKLDLSQAEAVVDLINSQTQEAGLYAIEQLRGRLSERVSAVREEALGLLARIEAKIDFPDDLEDLSYADLYTAIAEQLKKIEGLLARSQFGKIIKEGISTAITGRPNVGKSSLLNALLEEDRAIVSPHPGTTRDVIEETINFGGIILKIADTAGICEPENVVEKEGIERARKLISTSELVLLVIDGSQELSSIDKDLLSSVDPKRTILVVNKSDRPLIVTEEKIKKAAPKTASVFISAKYCKGLQAIKSAIDKLFSLEGAHDHILLNKRHEQCLLHAKESLHRAIDSAKMREPLDCIVIDLRDCVSSLGEVSGVEVGREVVEKIFGEFCVGK